MEIELPLVHITCTLYGNWLPGDDRGFRSRDHKLHSSGDYRHPPPRGEHAGLKRIAQEQMRPNVVLTERERELLGTAFVRKLLATEAQIVIVAVAATHVHTLLCPSPKLTVNESIRRAKQYASQQMKNRPGRVWARGLSTRQVETLDYARRVFAYIRDHGDREHAWVWRADRPLVD